MMSHRHNHINNFENLWNNKSIAAAHLISFSFSLAISISIRAQKIEIEKIEIDFDRAAANATQLVEMARISTRQIRIAQFIFLLLLPRRQEKSLPTLSKLKNSPRGYNKTVHLCARTLALEHSHVCRRPFDFIDRIEANRFEDDEDVRVLIFIYVVLASQSTYDDSMFVECKHECEWNERDQNNN